MSVLKEEKTRPKIIWSCSDCGQVLPLWQIRCTNCKHFTLSWLHAVFFGAVLLLLGLFVFVRVL